MPIAGEHCDQAENHYGGCRTASATKAFKDRNAEYNRGRAGTRQELVNAYKTERGCLICGFNEDPVALDLDHLSPEEKVAGVSRLLRYASWEAVLAELEKCQVLCSNCHRVKTMRGTRHLLAQAEKRRKPAVSSAEDGLRDEITDHLPDS